MTDFKQLLNILSQFEIQGTIGQVKPYGSGHINRTYLAETLEADQPNYILQAINEHVFKNVDHVMDNITQVCQHLKEKLQAQGKDYTRHTLSLIPSKVGSNLLRDSDNHPWRLYLFIEDARYYDLVTSTQVAYQGGSAFGEFQALLADFPINKLHTTIAKFHDIDHRLEQLATAINNDPLDRARQVTREFDWILSLSAQMHTLKELEQAGEIPLRVTHNDTKFNNVLLDQNDQALSVIDLDTVMPGLVHYDFSDSVRTATSTVKEDEHDLSLVGLNIDIFSAYAKGFLAHTHSMLNPCELEHLATTAHYLPYLICVRFLTDYIDGDSYFGIAHPTHNLDRARNQMKLTTEIQIQIPKLQGIIEGLYQCA